MRRWILRLALFILAFALAAGGYAYHYLSQNVPVGTAYFAKILCSGIFISGREADDILAVDLALDNPLVDGIVVNLDREERTVTALYQGLFGTTAVFREGLGCTLALGTTPEALREQAPPGFAAMRGSVPWPERDPSNPAALGADPQRLEAALDRAFAEPEPDRPRRTRAVVVVHNGRIVTERYAPGFDAEMPLTGWSMTKSLTNALVGVLVGRGLLDPYAPAPVREWRKKGDPRAAITVDQLLRMSSGLEFDETYGIPRADVQQMLFRSPSTAAFAAAKPGRAAPDSEWYYSSGTTNILAGIVRKVLEEAGENPLLSPGVRSSTGSACSRR